MNDQSRPDADVGLIEGQNRYMIQGLSDSLRGTMELKATYDKVTPLLARKAVPRTHDGVIPGAYSAGRDVWTVDTADGPEPIVNVQSAVAELASKTDSVRERDDPGDPVLLEMATKTSAELERDDQGFSLSLSTVELWTKTFVIREADDQ